MTSDTLQAGIERRTGIALWRQIADAIRAGISSGLGDEAGRLPPETVLAEQFGVNRHTVRSAISALVSEGVLRAEQGRGTFVVKQKRLSYPISKRTRFSTNLAEQGQKGVSNLASYEILEASAEVAGALGIEIGAAVHGLHTVSTGNDVPIGRSSSWFDAERFPNFAADFKVHKSATKTFSGYGVDDYVRQSTRIEACHATLEDIKVMRLSPGAIVLVTYAINADMNGRPIEYSKTRFSADRVSLQIDLEGSQS